MTDPATLLVIDDQASVRKIVKHTLRDYTVLEAAGADQAIEQLDQHEVDLILCDVMMPGCDGFELRGRLLEKEQLGDIPFIFLTALGDTANKVAGFELDASHYITKPFHTAELQAKVQSVLSLRASARLYSERERLSAIRSMVVTINHEINNPLTAVVGLSELILTGDGELPDDTDRRLRDVHKAAVRIQEVIQKLTAIERISTSPYLADVKMVDIDTAIKGTETSTD